MHKLFSFGLFTTMAIEMSTYVWIVNIIRNEGTHRLSYNCIKLSYFLEVIKNEF